MKKGYKGVPVSAARDIAKAFDKHQVIVVTWDRVYGKEHVATYGATVEECAEAAEGGNRVKKALGWPESMCNAEPSAMKKLKARIQQLENQLKISEQQRYELANRPRGRY